MNEPEHKMLQLNFIVGIGRSGTTLLTNILHRHPEIISTPENNFLLFAKSLRNKNFGDELIQNQFKGIFELRHNHETSIWSLNESAESEINESRDFRSAIELLYKHYDENKVNSSVVADKNPIYTLHIRTLAEIFPDARFIAIVRDFRDNIVSRKKHFYGWLNSDTLHACAWNMYYKAIKSEKKNCGQRMLLIRYEDLIGNTQDSIERICRHLGVKYSELMEHPDKNAIVITEKAEQTLGPEAKEKVLRMHSNLMKPINSEKSGYWKNILSIKEVKISETICGDTAKEYGYINTEKVTLPERIFIHLKAFPVYCYLYTYMAFFNFIYYTLPVRIKLKIFKKRRDGI